ncbi:glycosyltransferase family 2 protein [Sinomicrobium soli]|uniref:glycosyltransferase family 2 protein n=1 Tax=Sinomicrobium sp. N-1-3-6 TaxID=2219864 RepID=UPI000DCE46FA|nr:glycosyltransferase family 2 protein [Sinomicrobium sp. N-1-3-6]RAV30993.1 glycosyltransferase family 2 protein [Sinomicrobium sp. N-1-3-6]
MFSVIIPLYNKELSVKNTVQSVLMQALKDFEIIIVNDGSTDNSVEVVKWFSDPRIRLINQDNQGVSAARNKGIEEANYEWIVFLDGDDIWHKNHLTILKDMIEQYPSDKVFCTSYIKSGENISENLDTSIVVIENYFKEVMQHVDFFWTSVVCVHSSVFEKVGGFVVGICRGEDLELWARIGKYFRIIRSMQKTAVYRIDSENKLTSTRSKYNNSILSIIDLKGVKGYEKKYYQKMIYRRIKKDVKAFEIKDMLRLIWRYNFELLK